MSLVSELLEEVRTLKIKLWVEDGRLQYESSTPLPPNLLERLRASKPEILVALAGAASYDRPRTLSFAQSRLWFLHQLTESRNMYTIPFILKLTGVLNLEALKETLDEIWRRHEILRSRYPKSENGAPSVIVEESTDFFREHEAPGLDAALGLIRELPPLDILVGAVARAHLVEFGDGWLLYFLFDHLVFDGRSTHIFIREFVEGYNARVERRESRVLMLSGSYFDHAFREKERHTQGGFEEQLGFWREKLAGAMPISFPLIRDEEGSDWNAGAKMRFEIPVSQLAVLKRLAQSRKCSVFMVLLTAWKILLFQYTAQRDISIGVPISNRKRREDEALIGLYLNTVVVRTHIEPWWTFDDLLAGIKRGTLEAHANSDVPFDLVIATLDPERTSNLTPFFNSMFFLEMAEDYSLNLAGLEAVPLELDISTAKFDLNLTAQEMPEGLLGWLEYRKRCFDSEFAKGIVRHFKNLVQSIVADFSLRKPSRRIGEFEMLSAVEKKEILESISTSEAGYLGEETIAKLFEEQAAKRPDRVAITHDDQELTYGELNERANRLAVCLREKHGIGLEDRVGIFAERGLETIVGIVGIVKAGGAYVPLDYESPRERLEYIIADSNIKAILCKLGELAKIPTEVGRVELGGREKGEEFCENPEHYGNAENLAYIIYTSGTTGKPKGVMVEHRGVIRLVRNTNYFACNEHRVIAQASTIAFDAATFEIWGALLNGGRLVIMDRDVVLDVAGIGESIEARGIDTMFLTTALFNQVANINPNAFGRLNYLLFGGEACDPRLVKTVADSPTPPKRFLHVYGPTEATTFSTFFSITNAEDGSKNFPIGRPISNTCVLVLCDQGGALLPIGAIGEICIMGAGLARGYLNHEEATAERFVDCPVWPGERMYRTGDLGRWLCDGNLQFEGRRDDQIKLRGYRIELGEVETALRRGTGVEGAVACIQQLETGPALCGYIVLSTETADWEMCLKEELRKVLPSYMVPSFLVRLQELPVNPNGKLDRKSLPLPQLSRGAERVHMPPRTSVEKELVEIWQAVLNRGGIGIHENFFELGGHSLLAIQAIARVNKIFGFELPVRELFDRPTVEELAQSVALAISYGTKGQEPLATSGGNESFPLSPAQERMWFLSKLENSGAYNVPFGVHLKGNIDADVLYKSLRVLTARHPVLCGRIEEYDGDAMMVLDIDNGFEWRRERIRDEALVERILAEVEKPFALEKGPLFRAVLMELPESEYVLLMVFHHIVIDEWSMQIFWRDFIHLYERNKTESDLDLKPPAIHYGDYARWQRECRKNGAFHRELQYWTEKLDSGWEALELPTDRPRPPVQTYAGGAEAFDLSEELSGKLSTLSSQHGVTMHMLLLAAYRVLLYRYGCQGDVLIGSPVTGRNRVEFENVIGLFLNTVAMRNAITSTDSFAKVLECEKKTTLEAFSYANLPFEILVENLSPERDSSRNPLFQTMFVWQNANAPVLTFPGIEVLPLKLPWITSKFDLTLIVGREKELRGSIEYNASLFERRTVQRMIQHFEMLLESIAANPGQEVGHLEMLGDEEARQILIEFNETTVEYGKYKTIVELFEEQVRKTADNIAVVFAGEKLTFRELDDRASRLAQCLRKEHAVGPEVCVGILVERSLEMIVGILGILKAGGAYVPLDPGLPIARLEWLAQDAGLTTILSQERYLAKMAGFVMVSIEDASLYEYSVLGPELHAGPSNVAYVIYTSGSTGLPKAVAIEHASLTNQLLWLKNTFAVGESDVIFQKTTYTFDASVWELLLPLICGARVAFASVDPSTDTARLWKEGQELGITILQMVPTMLDIFADCQLELPTLRAVFVGGEVLKSSLVRKFYEHWKVDLINFYGPTEVTINATFSRVRLTESVTIGRPVANVRAYVLDEMLKPVPIGAVGEVCLAGVQVGRGYIDRAELTAEKFIENPYRSGERMYRTGDLGRWLSDGNLEYLGRIDDQVKIRGHRIELGEVEAVLAQQVGVRAAAARVWEQKDGDKALCGYIVGTEAANEEQIKSALRRTLPYYMIPTSLQRLESIPLTPSGKIDRKRLPKPQIEPQSAYEAPQTATQTTLGRIWAEVLKAEKVGAGDNFFSLGGHSLLVIRMVNRVRKEMGVEITVRQVFECPELRQLGEEIDKMHPCCDEVTEGDNFVEMVF
jgi:amino acid adenylation domain-containing protein